MSNVEVMYADGDIIVYPDWQWELLRDGIIKNLYNKGLCDIKYLKDEKTKGSTADAQGNTDGVGSDGA